MTGTQKGWRPEKMSDPRPVPAPIGIILLVTGLAADSILTAGDNPRRQRRGAAILAMIRGAFAGDQMALHSISLALAICFGMTGSCALTRQRLYSERRKV